MAAILAVLLGGCVYAGGGTPYWAVAPVHEVRNSPIPVPRPAMKPRPPHRLAVVPAARPAVAKRPPAAIPGRMVTVRRGDTVYGIARRHAVAVADLVAINRLEAPYLLHPGERLRLPEPRMHVVRRGETLFAIAQGHDLEVDDLARANNLRPPWRIRPGDRLRIPSGRGAEMAVAARPSSGLPVPPPRSGRGFDWPVSGPVVSTFGPKTGGLRNDGINIAAPRGAPVRAAEAGVVAYAGNGLRGFGNLILIRHHGAWVTAYAHNDALLVRRGDTVARGQMIARVGSTGGVTTPQLHFEIRRGAKAVDPLVHLPILSAAASR
ncbi:MAG: peptidoglycan DD-metalloendopeptidase family protein [Rhodothalassiaceae bacterium]